MHPRHHATLHRRENLHLIDLLSHAIHNVHQQLMNVKLAGAVLNARHLAILKHLIGTGDLCEF